MNLAAVIDSHAPDRTALVHGASDETVTYGELRDRVERLRGGLMARGLEANDRVAILTGNDPTFVQAYLAIVGAGQVAVPLNPLSPPAELTRELGAVAARAIVVGDGAGEAFAGVDRDAVGSLEHVFAAGEQLPTDATPLEELSAGPPRPPVFRVDADLAVLLFTAGTAGAPKAAMLTHGNLRANIDQLLTHPARLQTADDVALGLLPMFHIFGLNVVLGASLTLGSTVVLIDRFDPAAALDLISRHGVTIVSGPPTMYGAWLGLTDAPADAFAGVRLAASGAAPLPIELAAAFEQRFGVAIHQGYGLTETAPVVTTAAGTDAPPESIGVPLPGVEVRLVDAAGEDVLVGDRGEVWVRGENVFAGYWNDPDATRQVLTDDGWLRTGDVAVADEQGRLYLVDRVKDLIIVSGFNVFPAEVEEVLRDHPGVDDAAVIGVRHGETGEAIKAFVVRRPDTDVDAEHLRAHCAAHLARYKCPDEIDFVDEIPHGFAGKLLRRVLE
jgi:long-chain acyl-CoA synthetase